MNILEKILETKRGEIAQRKTEVSLEQVRACALQAPVPPKFSSAFQGPEMGIIAEVKHQSPSAGIIREPFLPAEIAQAYQRGGANAISVLMDKEYFGGGEAHFREVRKAVDLPLLYKEFVVDPWQVWHAKKIGASGVLLIAAALNDDELKSLSDEVAEAGLEVLLEVHDQEELDRALALKAPMIGINNRNLKTFVTTLDTTLSLAKQLPEETILISESGIRTAQDLDTLAAAGAKGVLVGESLLRQDNVQDAVKQLRSTS